MLPLPLLLLPLVDSGSGGYSTGTTTSTSTDGSGSTGIHGSSTDSSSGSAVAARQSQLYYQNPIVAQAGVDLGDPGALFHDGYYYLATSSGDVADAFPIQRSRDRANWTTVGHVFPSWQRRAQPAWASGSFWAPDLQRINTTHFACYFSAAHKPLGLLSLGVAFSTSLAGPWIDPLGKPLWSNHSDPAGTIDVHFHSMHASGGREKYLVSTQLRCESGQSTLLHHYCACVFAARCAAAGAR
jgi:beta-xylosidase